MKTLIYAGNLKDLRNIDFYNTNNILLGENEEQLICKRCKKKVSIDGSFSNAGKDLLCIDCVDDIQYSIDPIHPYRFNFLHLIQGNRF